MNMIIRSTSKPTVIVFLMLLWFATSLSSQTNDISFNTLKEKYKGNDVVWLTYNESLFIEPSKDLLHIEDKTENQLMLLTDASSYYAKREISYVNHVSEITDIEAYTSVPKEKGGYKKVKVNEFKESKNTSQEVFFDDVNVQSFTYPQPVVGAICNLNYTENIKDPHFLGKFYFASGAPIVESVFRIQVHKNVDLKFILKNPAADISFTEATSGNFKIYTWTRKNVEKLKHEDNEKSSAYETPHLIVYIASYKGETGKHSVLENTKGLFDFCYSLLDKSSESHDEELQNLTDSVVSGTKDELEKIKRIYYFVQDHINYIAFEDGLGGFVPRKASLVCTRKYGDCKDIANLICTMLNYSGVKAYRTWIGTTDIPYKFSEVPTMGVANHMIASVYLNNGWLFLDGTAKFLSYQYPSGFIQGKQAMIAINKDSFLLVNVPVVPGAVNFTKQTIIAGFSGDSLIGKSNRSIDGLPRCNVVSNAYYVRENKKEEHWKNYLELAQNNCTIENLKITGLRGRDSLLNFSFDFKIPKYVTFFENEVYINLNLLRYWNNSDINLETRTKEFMFDEAYNDEIVTTFTVPPGYTISKIPADYVMDKGNYGFRFTYQQKGNNITYTQKYWFNSMELNKPDFKPWNETIDLLHKAFRQTVVLKKIEKK